MSAQPKNTFAAAATEKDSGLLGEFIAMMKQNKKYWLLPILAVLLLFGLLIVLGSSAAAPFIYTLF